MTDDERYQEAETQPRILYKYCLPERIDVLRNRRVRFTQRDELNDIYELKPLYSFDRNTNRAARERLALVHPEIPHVPEGTSEEHQSAADYALQTCLVLSLSSEWDIIPMWSYYAEGHKGLVIGFDFTDPFLQGKTTRRVQYTATFPVVENTFEQAIFFKFGQWKHEHEWRSLQILEYDEPDQTICGRVHLFKFSPTAVAEVILGHRMIEHDRCLVRDILGDPAYRHVKLFQAHPDNHAWRIRRLPIDQAGS